MSLKDVPKQFFDVLESGISFVSGLRKSKNII